MAGEVQLQHIYQSVDPVKKYSSGGAAFNGYFGVTDYAGDKLISIYLGKGTEIAEGGYSLKSAAKDGSANLKADQSKWLISCNQETEVGLPMPKIKKAILKSGNDQKILKITKTGAGIKVNVPPVSTGLLVLE
jgi:hypothetical protein